MPMDKTSLMLEHYKARVAAYEENIAELRAELTLTAGELDELRAQQEKPAAVEPSSENRPPQTPRRRPPGGN